MDNVETSKMDPNVLNSFRYEKLPDGSLRLYKEKTIQKELVRATPPKEDFYGDTVVNLTVTHQKKKLETVVMILRTSSNSYLVVGSNEQETKSKRCANVQEVSDFIKGNFCDTLFKGL